MFIELSSYSCFWITYVTLGWLFPSDPTALNGVNIKEFIWVLFRNFLITLPFTFVVRYIIPTITNFSSFGYFAPVLKFAATLLVGDFSFYLVHRLLHLPSLYKWHKPHHRFNKPYPYSALYCSPLEAVLCDEFSNSIGIYLFGMTFLEGCIWSIFVALYALTIHSTLRLPYFSGRDHNEHHGKFLGNYGLYTNIFDRLFGTFI